ncbi:MAG TPA: heme-binding protein [Rhizobiaceae bacterium]|nr:heme-binding protein [Rhizobiaceae bacterium]
MRTVEKVDLGAEQALVLAQAALAMARQQGWEIAVSVCDSRGVPLVLLRTDRVIDPAIGFAIDKAYTAAQLRRPTAAFAERALSRPPLALGLANRDRLLVFPGGLPVMLDGACIGGIGVSGATDEDDVQCARAALAQHGFETP